MEITRFFCRPHWKHITAFISSVWGKSSAQWEALAVNARLTASLLADSFETVASPRGTRLAQRKNMSEAICFFMDGLFWTAGETLVKIISNHGGAFYYQRPLISPSLSDNDSAGETSGDLHPDPPLGRGWQASCLHSWHFILVSLLIDVGRRVDEMTALPYKQCFPPFIYCSLFLTILRV